MENPTRRTTQRVISAFITLSFVITTLFSSTSPFSFKVAAADGGTETSPAVINASSNLGTATLTSGYYRLEGAFTNSGRLTVSGDVHLILADLCDVTITGGINCSVGNSLTIYGNTGKLTANGGTYQAGIGGGSGQAGGNITINGGTVTATGGYIAAGSGGANITINGGSVSATGGFDGAGIGADNTTGVNLNITINGGTVIATGNGPVAGIGGGYYCQGGTIIINGGTITATKGASCDKGDIGPGNNGADAVFV
ncbi:hypothetical protein FACS1894120_4690 [Clostridia bacterium]|nr:hypothetical protein FACS1894120_4690 [Clostridia bacterium]